MFAILITKENMPKIADREILKPNDLAAIERYYVDHRVKWYVITGYESDSGRLHEWTIFPASFFNAKIDYDPEKIQNDWTVVTKKERP